MNEIVARSLTSAGYHSQLEPRGLSDLDGKRPDGQTINPWEQGKRLAWDVTLVCTLAISHISATTVSAGAAAKKAETHKIQHYRHLTPTLVFEPLGFETLGPWRQHALKLVNKIGQRMQETSGEKRATEYLRQRLSFEIQRGNAICVMATKKPGENLDQIYSVTRPMRKSHRS